MVVVVVVKVASNKKAQLCKQHTYLLQVVLVVVVAVVASLEDLGSALPHP